MNGPSQPPGPEAEISADDSGLSRLSGIFLQPEATFEAINRRPNWLLPILAVMVVSFLANAFVISTIGYDRLLREQMEQSLQVQEMPEEQRQELIASQLESQFVRVLGYVAPVFSVFAILLVAGVLLLGVTLAGGQSTFRKVLSVTGHSFFAYSLVSSVLVCLVVYLNPEEVVSQSSDRGSVPLGLSCRLEGISRSLYAGLLHRPALVLLHVFVGQRFSGRAQTALVRFRPDCSRGALDPLGGP